MYAAIVQGLGQNKTKVLKEKRDCKYYWRRLLLKPNSLFLQFLYFIVALTGLSELFKDTYEALTDDYFQFQYSSFLIPLFLFDAICLSLIHI